MFDVLLPLCFPAALVLTLFTLFGRESNTYNNTPYLLSPLQTNTNETKKQKTRVIAKITNMQMFLQISDITRRCPLR